MEQSDALKQHKRYNAYIAALTTFIAFIAYTLTVAPTVPFWDCGEYIGAAWCLGIPHPPGNPMYMLIARVAMMLFVFFKDVALRANFLSVLGGAAVVLFVYLTVIRILVGWLGVPDSPWKRATVYTGGFVGALFAGLGNTFWFSCVEAEVNGFSMLFIAASTYVAVIWAQSRDSTRDRLLVLLSYLVFLGIGVHMFSMVAIVPVGLYVLVVDKEKMRDWRLWVAAVLLFSPMYSMSMFLFAAPLVLLMATVYAFVGYKDSRAYNVGIFVLATLVRGFVGFRLLSQNQIELGELLKDTIPFALLLCVSIVELMNDSPAEAARFRRRWTFIFWIAAFAVIGFSTHLYIPIRSMLEPAIDENNPQTWQSFTDFLERKQYGSDNMVLRMFHRRGTFGKQFGIDSNMGYGGFHLTQWFHFGPSLSIDRSYSLFKTHGMAGGWLKLFVYFLPTVFIIFGLKYLYRRAKNSAILLTALTLMGSVLLVLYMNFADGTRMERQDFEYWQQTIQNAMSQGLSRAEAESRIPKPNPVHREVRERDYFFTPGFMWMGASVGIAASCLLHLLFTSGIPFLRSYAGPIVLVLLLASPALPFASNFSQTSRAGDYVPYDYAYNLLMSCDKDGILFTNGDNDTFPLWALQEAFGIRKDVRVVNLSLLNTHWYILQLKNFEPKVPISYTDDEIERLPHERNPFEKDTPIRLKETKLALVVPGREKQPALRVQDKLVLNIVDANKWVKPIYMAVTVSNDNYMGLGPYISMEGLVYRVNPEMIKPDQQVNIDKTLFLLEKVYRYRNMGVPGINLNETTYRLLANYSAGYLYVAYAMREPLQKLKTEAAALAQAAAASSAPDSVRLAYEQKNAEYLGRLDELTRKLDECVALMPWDWRPRTIRHQTLMANDRFEEAVSRAREALLVNDQWPDYKKMLVEGLERMGRADTARAVLKEILDTDQDPWYTYLTLVQSYAAANDYDSAIHYLKRFQSSHPGDQRAASLIAHYERQKAAGVAADTQNTLRVVP